jgi:FtsP/CotA-like multicopper oxidase with cupredoxin domain
MNMKTTNKKTVCMTFLLMACLFAMAGSASAATYNLRAGTVNITMPDGAVIPAWGFADDTGITAGTGTILVPGPKLEVIAPDTTLTINLTNNLAVPVSINIPGQRYPVGAAPTISGGRVMSFTNQVAAGGSGTITFNNLRPGTFLYESGTTPAMEIPMGLYGALVVRPTTTASPAYGNNPPYNVNSTFSNEAVILLSEIDPAFNTYVNANNTTVDAANKINYSISYAPKYFLINGKAYPQTTDISAPHGQRTLLRLINAGTRNTVPTIQGTRLAVIAEDGNLLNYARHEFSPSLNAGKTLDVITAPTSTGYHAFYDRRLGTSNAGVFPGGILTFIGDLNCSPLKGDVNGDGRITTVDAVTVLQAFVAGTTNTLPASADVSLDPASGLPCGNGTIDLLDVLLLLQKATGFNPY